MPTMQLEHITQIFCHADIVVIGQNSEMADYDNPRGYLYGFRAYVFAEAPDGSRWVFDRTCTRRSEFDALGRVATFVAHVQRSIEMGRKLDPEHWTETRPGYGSEAYDRGGWSQIDAMEERVSDEEFYL